jgi:hypothetical protein
MIAAGVPGLTRTLLIVAISGSERGGKDTQEVVSEMVVRVAMTLIEIRPHRSGRPTVNESLEAELRNIATAVLL